MNVCPRLKDKKKLRSWSTTAELSEKRNLSLPAQILTLNKSVLQSSREEHVSACLNKVLQKSKLALWPAWLPNKISVKFWDADRNTGTVYFTWKGQQFSNFMYQGFIFAQIWIKRRCGTEGHLWRNGLGRAASFSVQEALTKKQVLIFQVSIAVLNRGPSHS